MATVSAADDRILLKHGAGGRAMRRLIEDSFLRAFAGEPEEAAGVIGLSAMDDGAAVRIGDQWLVITTDSHVIQPVFFPGGDIGRLAVCGTVNDLAMMGATEVLGLTCGVIGQAENVVVLSVTEGEDKPLKYLVMFRKADLVLITKTDLLPHLPGVSLEALLENLARVMPDPRSILLSAVTGFGMSLWLDWLRRGITPAPC
jgi:hypothetical protein